MKYMQINLQATNRPFEEFLRIFQAKIIIFHYPYVFLRKRYLGTYFWESFLRYSISTPNYLGIRITKLMVILEEAN